MAEPAHLLHVSPGRVRLRCPRLRGDAGALDGLARRLAGLAGVCEVRGNTLTGTLLVLHRASPDALLEASAPLVRLEDPEPLRSLRAEVGGHLEALARGLERSTGGALDPRALAFLAFLAIGLTQLARGQVLMPAATAFWYAIANLGEGPAPDPPSPDDA